MENRHIHFFSDPPHLIKTIRNCLSNKKRHLWVSVIIAHLDKSLQAKFIPQSEVVIIGHFSAFI